MTQRQASDAPAVDPPATRLAAPFTEVGPAALAAVALTERILDRLPGRRLAWLLAWAVVPWLNLAVVLTADAGSAEAGDVTGEVFNRIAVSFAILLSLWGVAVLTDELRRLRPALVGVVEEGELDVARLFRGLDSVAGPLLLTLAIGVVLPLDEALRGDPVSALIQAVTWLLIGIPLSTTVWVYVTLQLGLDRLGRGHLTLQEYGGDLTLGLQPVGRLAFTGFWMLFGAAAPLVLTGSSDLPAVIVGTGVLVVGVGLFFLSLRRLHRQMAMIKHREVDRARNLYRQAYQRVQGEPTLEVLQEQTALLNAAEALEKRAERIQSWPFDESTFARVATIATSVAAMIVARMLLAPTGL